MSFRTFAEGWAISGVMTLQSGLPFSILDSAAGTLFGPATYFTTGSLAPGMTLDDAFRSGRVSSRVNQYFNTGVFVPAPFIPDGGLIDGKFPVTGGGTIFGNLGRNVLRGPGQRNVDMALIKRTRLGGNANLVFRWEVFNVFNWSNFANPSSDVSSPNTFGNDQRHECESSHHAIRAEARVLNGLQAWPRSPAPLSGGRQDDVLWDDGERLYRRMWRDPGDGTRREFLVAQPCAEHPTLAAIRRLTHEHALKDYLDHPWALRPLELVREHGQTMLVLESTAARPLDQIIGAGAPVDTFLRLAITVTNAVARLHECGLVHKDIKASNILIDARSGEVRLTGFGIATRLPRQRQTLDPPELLAGTLSHMAPEQTGRMNRSIDSRSDLYSLGITFYHALTGKLPFAASEPMEWVHCHIARSPVPPRAVFDSIPAQLSAHRHEAAGEDSRGAVPDRRRRRA